jgi:hypothetical protein
VTQRFIVENDIPTGYIEQIRDFVMRVMEEEEAKRAFTLGAGGAAAAAATASSSSSSASRARTTTLAQLATMPVQEVVSIAPMAFDKVLAAILVKSDAVAAASDAAVSALALTVDERATMASLFETLKNEGFYHSSVLPSKPAMLAVTKLALWPGEHAAAAFDLLRKMALHAEGAKVHLAPRLAEIVPAASAAVASSASSFGTKATGLGLLSNLFVKPETRAAALHLLEPVAAAAAACAEHPKPMVRARAMLLLCNATSALAKEAETRGAKVDDDAALQAGAVALGAAASACLQPADTAQEVRVSAVTALGTAVLCSTAARDAALAAGGVALAEGVQAAAPAGSRLLQAAKDLIQSFKE